MNQHRKNIYAISGLKENANCCLICCKEGQRLLLMRMKNYNTLTASCDAHSMEYFVFVNIVN